MNDQDIFNYINFAEENILSSYEKYSPINLKHYLEIQIKWLERERNLLKTKLQHNPTEEEFINYIENSKHSTKFRIFYCLKYPDKVKYQIM